jgi:hypothetical protein
MQKIQDKEGLPAVQQSASLCRQGARRRSHSFGLQHPEGVYLSSHSLSSQTVTGEAITVKVWSSDTIDSVTPHVNRVLRHSGLIQSSRRNPPRLSSQTFMGKTMILASESSAIIDNVNQVAFVFAVACGSSVKTSLVVAIP